jgi:thiamine biosynthesis lipoprotein
MSSAPAADSERFEAWSTYVELQVETGTEEAVAIARETLSAVDLAASRFRTDSELSAVNRAAGEWVAVSPLFEELLTVAVDAATVTGGLVDPCLGRTLIELGYDRDIGLVTTTSTAEPTTAPRANAWQDIAFDGAGRVRIPDDVALDLGSTAKAWTSDRIAERIAEELATPVLVGIGGDIRIAGPRAAAPWPIRITETPTGEDDVVPACTVVLDRGGLATSSTRVRRWHAGQVERHHLLDPTSGRPVSGPWRTATTTGPTCVAANVASLAALVLQDRAVAWLAQHQVDARLVGRAGRVRTTGLWPEEDAAW